MMKFTGLEVLKQGVPEEKIWMSFERKMSCAVGKCGHCRIDEVYVCLDIICTTVRTMDSGKTRSPGTGGSTLVIDSGR